MSIRQLDLVAIGQRAITSRLGAVEGSVRRIATFGYGDTDLSLDAAPRANLLTNSSFESYQRNTTYADGWSFTNAVVATAAQADGLTVASLSPSATIQQSVQGSTSYAAGAFAFTVAARSLSGDQTIGLNVTHTSAELGAVYRIALDGSIEETTTVPGDGQWYRFVRSGLLLASGTVSVQVTTPGGNSGAVQVDAAKFEYEQGAEGAITPTAYQPEDAGLASMVRNFRADNIVAGTLTVGGSDSSNPKISVLDSGNFELVTIGDPTDGYYGINVKGGAGILVSGSGSVLLTGGGSVSVSNGGSVLVGGTGVIRAGTAGGQRVQLSADGLAAFNSSNQEQVRLEAATGRMRVFGSGAISVEGGGSFIAGTPGAARMEYTADGLFAYDALNTEKVSISVADATVRVASDALIIDGELVLDDLQIDGELSVGQDLRVGTNVLFVDQSQSNVGINRAPDPQFDLDIAGNIRWGGWGVGKMAIQLDGATAIMHYDGAMKTLADYSGFLESHLGLQPSVGGTGNVFVPGKFGKALYANVATSNLAGSDPSFELGVDGWSSSWGDTVASTTAAPLFGARSLAITADGTTTGVGIRKDISVTPGTTYTLSAYVRAPVGRRMRARVWDGAAWTTYLGNSEYSPSNGLWARVEFAFTPSQNVARCVIMDDEAGSLSSGTYYVDAVQLEVGRAASPFTTTNRARTTLGYPGAGVLSPSAGTLMAWANPEGISAGDTAFLLHHFFGSGNRLYVYYFANELRWAAGDTFYAVTGATVPTGWTHYALAWENGIGYLYVNGVLVQSGAFSGLTATDGALRVGNDGQVSNGWRGRIDEVVVLNRAAPASEIRAVYESNAPVFAETSNWGFRTANTLAWADEEGLWATDGSGNAAFGVSGTNGKSWGGLTIDAGDVLLGNSTSYVWWDASDNTVKMTGDFTAGNITGSTIRTGTSGARIVLSPAEGVAVLASDSSYRVVIPTTGGINLYTSTDPSEVGRTLGFFSGGTRRAVLGASVNSGTSQITMAALNGSGNSVGTTFTVFSDQTIRAFTNFQEMFRINAWPNGIWMNGQLTVSGGPVEISGTGGFFNANSSTGGYRVNGTQVVGPRDTGWGTTSGTTSKASFDTGTVTLAALAQRVGAMWNALRGHGLIGN